MLLNRIKRLVTGATNGHAAAAVVPASSTPYGIPTCYFYPIVNTWLTPEFQRDFWGNPRLQEDVQELTAGLDSESVRVVNGLVQFVLGYVNWPIKEQHTVMATDAARCTFLTDEDILRVLNEPTIMTEYRKVQFADVAPTENWMMDSQRVVLLHGLAFVPNGFDRVAGTTFLDVGGYRGDSVLAFERRCNPKQIFSFEPDPATHPALCGMVQKYGLKRTTPIQMCVGDTVGEAHFNSSDVGWGNVDKAGKVAVKTTTLDTFVAERKIERVGLIKVDTEGFEQQVLNGARATLKRDKPVILMSIYHKAEHYLYMRKWVSEMNPDYRFMVRRTCPQAILDETVLVCY